MTTNTPLPLFSIEPNSVVVATNVTLSDTYVKQLIQEAHTCSFFGFDIELMPCRQVPLVQIASGDTVYVLDINKINHFLHTLKSFLGNEAYVKLGVGVHGQAKSLLHSDEVELAGAGELS